jgi:hypothetical protein
MLTPVDSLTIPCGSGTIGAACAVEEMTVNDKPVSAIAKPIRLIGAPALIGRDNVRTTPQFHAETVE